MRRLLIVPLLALLALTAGLALGLLPQRDTFAADAAVNIQNFAFAPASASVNVGDSVTWTNNDTVPHTATADGGTFDTGNLNAGGSGSVTFSTAGTFTYFCAIHPNMRGTVVVTAAPGGATQPAGGATTPATGGTAGAPATGSGYAAQGDGPPWALIAGGAALVLGAAGMVAYRRTR